jgi:hypothetical protein
VSAARASTTAHGGVRPRVSSRVCALALYLRCDVVNSIFQQEAAADLSSALFGCHIMHQRLVSGIRPSHDHLCLLSRGLSLGPGSTGLTWPLWAQAWLRGWLRGLDSIPTGNSAALGSLSRVQESPEPRWEEEGRLPRVWGSGAPSPSNRTLVRAASQALGT